jgi:hypothetical protein
MVAMPVSGLCVCVLAPCRLSETSFSCCFGSNVWNSNHAHTPPPLNKRLGTPTSRIKTTPKSTVTLPNQPPEMCVHMAKVLLSSTTRVAAAPKFSSQVSVTSSEPGIVVTLTIPIFLNYGKSPVTTESVSGRIRAPIVPFATPLSNRTLIHSHSYLAQSLTKAL